MGLKATIPFTHQDRDGTDDEVFFYIYDGDSQVRLVVSIEIPTAMENAKVNTGYFTAGRNVPSSFRAVHLSWIRQNSDHQVCRAVPVEVCNHHRHGMDPVG